MSDSPATEGMTLRKLQAQLPWVIPYSQHFRDSQDVEGHRHLTHDLLHIYKSLGHIAAMAEKIDHGKLPGMTVDQLAQETADLVICALHIANSNPLGGFSLQGAVLTSLDRRNGSNLTESASEPPGSDIIPRSIITNLIAAVERREAASLGTASQVRNTQDDLDFAMREARQYMSGLHTRALTKVSAPQPVKSPDPVVSSEWRGQELWWCINGDWIEDHALKCWHVNNVGTYTGPVILQCHVVAYANRSALTKAAK